MASDTVSTNSEDADLALSWSGRWTLAHRILALNVLTVVLVALSTLYLDVFRNRLSKERTQPDPDRGDDDGAGARHVAATRMAARILASISKTDRQPAAALRPRRHGCWSTAGS